MRKGVVSWRRGPLEQKAGRAGSHSIAKSAKAFDRRGLLQVACDGERYSPSPSEEGANKEGS